jgi:hypothetical protein
MTSDVTTNFRKVERQSNFRANIFLIECLSGVLAIYLHYVYVLVNTTQSHLLALVGIAYMFRLNLMSRCS